jgi:hypothetical protein
MEVQQITACCSTAVCTIHCTTIAVNATDAIKYLQQHNVENAGGVEIMQSHNGHGARCIRCVRMIQTSGGERPAASALTRIAMAQ